MNGAPKYQHGTSTFRGLYKANIVYDNSFLLTRFSKPHAHLIGKYLGILIDKCSYIQAVGWYAFF